MKRTWMFFLVVMLVLSLAVGMGGCGPAAEPEPDPDPDPVVEPDPDPEPLFIVIATGGPGGTYFPLGAGIARAISNRVEGVFAQSESTGASVENSRLVGGKESEMGMAMANVAFNAYAGEGPFEGEKQDIVALFSMYPAVQHLFVSADSDIYSIDDLAGKTISVGAPGSGNEVTAGIILRAAGLWGEVDAVNYSQPEAADAFRDGHVDAVFYNFAFPGAVVTELQVARDIRFIPLEADLLDKIIADYPYFTKGVLPAGVYGLEEDVSALTVGNLMLVHRDMDDDLAYSLVEAIFNEESLKELAGIHPIAKVMNKEIAANAPIPLHPGAARFFRDN